MNSHLCSFALRFLFRKSLATSYSFYSSLLYTVKEKGGKHDRKPYSLPYGLRNPYRNPMPEKPYEYAQKPQQNCTFVNSAFVLEAQNALRCVKI